MSKWYVDVSEKVSLVIPAMETILNLKAGGMLRGPRTEYNSSILNVLKLNKTVHHHVAYLSLNMNPYSDFLIQAYFVYKLGLKRHNYQFFTNVFC